MDSRLFSLGRHLSLRWRWKHLSLRLLLGRRQTNSLAFVGAHSLALTGAYLSACIGAHSSACIGAFSLACIGAHSLALIGAHAWPCIGSHSLAVSGAHSLPRTSKFKPCRSGVRTPGNAGGAPPITEGLCSLWSLLGPAAEPVVDLSTIAFDASSTGRFHLFFHELTALENMRKTDRQSARQ